MKISLVLTALVALTSVVGCGTSRLSVAQVAERHDVPPANVAAADVQTFLTHASALAASTTTTGTIPVLEFLKLMPLQNGPRQALASAFPGAFVANCASGRCQVVAHGNAASAVMEVTIDGIVNPTLVLSPTVTASFVMRGDHAVEFCGMDGLDVRQFIFSRAVQGLRLSLDAGQPHLNVNIDDDGANYTCN